MSDRARKVTPMNPNSDKRLLLAAHYPGGLHQLDTDARELLAAGNSTRATAKHLSSRMEGVKISHTTVRAWYTTEDPS